MKNLIWIVVVLLFTSCGNFQLGNNTSDQAVESTFPVKRIQKDSTVKVTKPELIYLIQKGTLILANKKIEDLTDDEHILIILLLNTKWLYIPKDDIELNSKIFKFSEALNEVDYARKVGEIHEWVPNLGMGMYFPKLDIHYGGGITSGWGFFELKK